MQIYVPTPPVSPVSVPAQVADASSAGKPKIETEIEVEHVFGAGQQPFTILAATLSRTFNRFGADAVQFSVDGFAGGEFPYIAFRLEGCRSKAQERLTAKVCAGLGASRLERGRHIAPHWGFRHSGFLAWAREQLSFS